MNQQRTYGYLHEVLEGAILRLEGAEAYAIGDPLLGNVLEHLRGSLRQARAALDMSPAVITQSGAKYEWVGSLRDGQLVESTIIEPEEEAKS